MQEFSKLEVSNSTQKCASRGWSKAGRKIEGTAHFSLAMQGQGDELRSAFKRSASREGVEQQRERVGECCEEKAEGEWQLGKEQEGSVRVDLYAGPSRVTGEVQVVNANAPGSTLYRVEGVKVCHMTSQEPQGKERQFGDLHASPFSAEVVGKSRL